MKIRLMPILTIMFLFILLPSVAFADFGPKPTLDIFVKNYINEPFYLTIDSSPNAENPDPEKMYKYQEAYLYINPSEIRDSFRYDDILTFKHCYFGFYNIPRGIGLPNNFRIYLQYESGEIIVSNPITNDQFAKLVLFDAKTGKAENISMLSIEYYIINYKTILKFLLSILITLLIEILISLPFKIKPVKVIVFTNILTQILFYAIILGTYRYIYFFFFIFFFIIEALIWFIEYLIYRKFTKSGKSIAAYVILANSISMVLSIIAALQI